MNAVTVRPPLDALSARLRELHSHALAAAGEGGAATAGFALFERLINDPEWAWLRPLSALMADIDQVTSEPQPACADLEAAAAAQVRGLLFGDGELSQPAFLERYRPLLQRHSALASTHGELRRLLRAFPLGAAGESERLRARQHWAARCQPRRRAG